MLPTPTAQSCTLFDFFTCSPFDTVLEKYVGGQKKHELSAWWLGLVEKTVEDFLQSNGYDMNVIPYNYLDERPKSLEEVSNHLQLIR